MFTYTTPVRIKPEVIAQELKALKQDYLRLDPTQELRKLRGDDSAKPARSAFSRYNNLWHFYNRLMQQDKPSENIPIVHKYEDGSVLINVTASAKGNSARVYFKPSITSLTKEVRKAVIPVNDENIFVYMDIRAAEFALRCVQAQDEEHLANYRNGGDIYMTKANLFPQGTERDKIKRCLIASMYGRTSYSTAKDLGITETQAQRILDSIERNFIKLTMLKRSIIQLDRAKNGYYAPNGFNRNDLVKVASIDRVKGFDPNLAWSVYTQSALGFVMQQFSKKFLDNQKGVQQTFLSIFDSIVVEMKPTSRFRFEEFVTKAFAPLLPDEFKVGNTMYQAMYE